MKLKLLVDLEIMRLGLIPFDVDASAAMADWSEDRKRKHFRKFRKLVRKAARFTAEREMRLWGREKGWRARGTFDEMTRKDRREWVETRFQHLWNPAQPNRYFTGSALDRWRFYKRRTLLKNYITHLVAERVKYFG